MAITILPPAPAVPAKPSHEVRSAPAFFDEDEEMEDGSAPGKPTRNAAIVTPGQTITDEPQWMRGHGTYIPSPTTSSIFASVAGTVIKTNKLLSVRPLRARYTPEIGDLVVGRIVEVQSKRWKVDLSAPLLANLPLSAINLPGGILRRRTTTDELQIRTFFSEGDLLVAEVQTVHGDGCAGLHTRSLKYGKLRNGVFLSVAGLGSGGVARSRRQVWTVQAGNNGGAVDIVLGVNGYIWIAKHTQGSAASTDQVSITRLEEAVSNRVYSSQNERIGAETRREISRIASCIRALVDRGVRVEEDVINRAYEAALEIEAEEMRDEGEGVFLGGEKGARVVEMALAAIED